VQKNHCHSDRSEESPDFVSHYSYLLFGIRFKFSSNKIFMDVRLNA